MNNKSRIRIAITAVLLFLFLFANFYAVRRMAFYAVQAYLYDKLLVAYRVGGMPGLKSELEEILSSDKMPRELAEARGFKSDLDNIKDPGKFLSDIARQKKAKINFLRNLRIAAFALILVALLARVIVNAFI
ncbi:MAG: hypothetical protein PHF11_05890 [Candidatus Omnitrophica bacterium]|nr:hypothetical protein [Candidatus Omnitrophota bacterium]